MRKFVLLALCALALVACKKEYPAGLLPVYIVTGEVSDLTPYTATLNGQYFIRNGMKDIEYGMIFSESPSLLESNSRVVHAHGTDNNFSVSFDNLRTETTYYYKSFINYREGFNLEKKDYGEVRSFTTPPINAVVTTGAAIAGTTYIYVKSSVSIEFKCKIPRRYAYMLFGKTPEAVEKKSKDNSVFCSINDDNDDEWTFETTYKDIDGQTCYYRALVEYEDREYYGEIKQVSHIPFAPTAGSMIDMGLSVKWAGWNVGASKPEEDGDYFAWGETASKTEYTKENYLYNPETPGDLPVSADAASVALGAGWRMPTVSEFDELIDNSLTEWGQYSTVPGMLFISKKNGNTIFFPASGVKTNQYLHGQGINGYYWTRDYNSEKEGVECCSVSSARAYTSCTQDWFNGFSVRAVND